MPKSQDYRYSLKHSPAYASLIVDLDPRQTILVESSAMAAMDYGIQMKSRVKGGLFKGVQRMLGGESLFISEFTAGDARGQLHISPGVPGDIQYFELTGDRALMVQSAGFVACSPTVEMDTQFQGFKGFFSGESLFLLRFQGKGDLWFSSYGGIIEIPVSGNYVVDTGYIVAFEESLSYNVELLGGLSFKGLRTGLFGGDGLVCRFSGEGRLWVQSRQVGNLINFLNPFRPTAGD